MSFVSHVQCHLTYGHGEDVEQLEFSYTGDESVDWLEETWQCLVKPNTDLPYDLAILLLFTYPREMNAYTHQRAYKSIS